MCWSILLNLLMLIFVSWGLNTEIDYELDSEELMFSTTTSEPFPYFDDHFNLTNITAPLGATAFLHCKVNLLKDKTVSWMKKGPSGGLRLLTFGLSTYSGDERLSINFEQPNNWKLRISATEKADDGAYQCQISTHPPIVLHVTLSVIVPQISFVDDFGRSVTDKFYNAGSTLELRCVITHLPLPYTILWKQGNKTLNHDTSRGGISVKTVVNKENAVSVLYIANAKKNDSGEYICSIGNLTQNAIYVHVINGDVPAAMQHSNGAIPTLTTIKYQNFSTKFMFFLATFFLIFKEYCSWNERLSITMIKC